MDPLTNTLNRQIGKRLRDARLLRGLSQEKLGEMVGVTFQQIQKYENGINGLSPAKMTKCAESLGVTTHYFLNVPEEVPQTGLSNRKLLILMQALQELEKQHPATFLSVCDFIIGLAKTKRG